MKHKLGLIIVVLLTVLLIGLVAIPFLRPTPISVDSAIAKRGALQVTVNGEGKTRVKDRFTVAAPVTGRLTRIQLRRGDPVMQGDSIARIDPLPLAPLDPRQRAEANARVRAAEATKREVDAQVEHLKADLEQAHRDTKRSAQLLEAGVISRQEFEQTQNAETTVAKDLEAAQNRAQSAAHEVEIARAALLTLDKTNGSTPRVVIAPVSGRVLRVFEESERVISAGAPLLELSNPSKLEVVIDVLSTDAVKVSTGAKVLIVGWGGPDQLEARVRLVEPSAFTKVSALGIEEQRVNIIADFVGSTGSLGDGYRVDAQIVTWENDDVLKVPASALFRDGEKWSLFVVESGRARRLPVEVGKRTSYEAEILGGLEEGREVVLHPPNDLGEGSAVETKRDSSL